MVSRSFPSFVGGEKPCGRVEGHRCRKGGTRVEPRSPPPLARPDGGFGSRKPSSKSLLLIGASLQDRFALFPCRKPEHTRHERILITQISQLDSPRSRARQVYGHQNRAPHSAAPANLMRP